MAYLPLNMQLLFSLFFNDFSAWWLIPCFALGFAFATLLYQKTNLENRNLSFFLFGLRFVFISSLAVLLLAPLLKSIQKRLEKPLIIIAQDASASIAISSNKDFDAVKYHQDFKQLAHDLGEDAEVKILNFGSAVKPNFDFTQKEKQSDLSVLFNYINDVYVNRNIGAVVIASDGIINKGVNPIAEVKKSSYPVFAIAMGDTIPKKDLILSRVNYNNLVYLGNDHNLEIQVSAFKAKNVNALLSIVSNDGQSKKQAFNINADDWQKTFNLPIATYKKGIQKIKIAIQPVKGELSIQNNEQTIFVEVLDGREKVLLVADAPHPDVAAIKQAIENNKNYEVKVALADDVPSNLKDYGLIIFHNLPSLSHPIANLLAQSAHQSRWFIVGANTNTSALNLQQNLLNIGTTNAIQEYLPALNKDFYAFSLADETKNRLADLGALVAPFGNYALKNAASVLMSQRLGNVISAAPLLSFGNDGGVKTAILTGEGIWRWSLEDFEKHQNHDAVDELISKSVQYLSAKDDQRKFRVFPAKTRFTEDEHMFLNAELYNDVYELNNDADVSISLKSDNKIYSYLFSKVGKSYQLDAGFLPAGEYSFDAKTKLGNTPYTAHGRFLVETLNVELMQTTANHQLLYNLAKQSEGNMVAVNNLLQLKDLIAKNEKVKTISYEDKHYESLINLKWVFAILMLILSLEWFLRKRNGLI